MKSSSSITKFLDEQSGVFFFSEQFLSNMDNRELFVFIRSTKHASIFQGTSISKTFITGQKIIHASSTCAVGKVKCVLCAVASFGVLWF